MARLGAIAKIDERRIAWIPRRDGRKKARAGIRRDRWSFREVAGLSCL